MDKQFLIGKVTAIETFKVSTQKKITLLHITSLQTTNPETLGFIRVECAFKVAALVKENNIKVNKKVFIEFEEFKLTIQGKRRLINVKAIHISLAKTPHFKQIKELIKE